MAAVAVAVGLMTIYSMVKIWLEAFWKPLPATDFEDGPPRPLSAWKLAPVAVLALLTLMIGLGAEPVCQLAVTAAEELMNPQAYVNTVLYGG